jgi:hypothetical protein
MHWESSGASFSENFYGLKRRRRPWIETERAREAVGGIPAGEKLRDREINRSLLFLVGISYCLILSLSKFFRLGYHTFEQRRKIILKSSAAVSTLIFWKTEGAVNCEH